MKKITLIIIILISNNLIAQSDKLNRFYDFGIEIDFHHLLLNDDFKVIFPNGSNYKKLNKNFLYKIRYSYDKNRKRIPIDTLKVKLNKSEMDKIFTLTVNQFDVKYDENLSEYKIPPPPPAYDGLIVSLILDLNFRGDKFEKVLGLPFENQEFLKLYNYIETIFKNNRTE